MRLSTVTRDAGQVTHARCMTSAAATSCTPSIMFCTSASLSCSEPSYLATSGSMPWVMLMMLLMMWFGS